MRNCLLFTSNVIRMFIGLPFSKKIEKTISPLDMENATDGVKLAELFSAIFFSTNLPTKLSLFC